MYKDHCSLFIYLLFLSVLGLGCWVGFSLSCSEQGNQPQVPVLRSLWAPSKFPAHPALGVVTEQSGALCHTANAPRLSVYMRGSVCISTLCSQFISLHCSLCLCLHSCHADSFISTIFLDSTWMLWYTGFVLLWLLSLRIIGSRFIHLIRTDLNELFFIAE